MLRDIVIFLAGAAAFHTISHIALPYMVNLPLHSNWGIIITATMNNWTIVISGLITLALLWLASRLNKTV